MSAFKYEYELAQKDGVLFYWNTRPIRIMGTSHVEGLECVRTRLEGSGRRARVESIRGTEFVIPADMVVRAPGQQAA
jgi:NADPH-dependent glutamate synthase beta subunit-like oxidoreductase